MAFTSRAMHNDHQFPPPPTTTTNTTPSSHYIFFLSIKHVFTCREMFMLSKTSRKVSLGVHKPGHTDHQFIRPPTFTDPPTPPPVPRPNTYVSSPQKHVFTCREIPMLSKTSRSPLLSTSRATLTTSLSATVLRSLRGLGTKRSLSGTGTVSSGSGHSMFSEPNRRDCGVFPADQQPARQSLVKAGPETTCV